MTFQPRYIAYAKDHGNSPEAQMAKDEIEWPGGIMAGFIIWMNGKLAKFYRLHPKLFINRNLLYAKAHEDFTKFLQDGD